MRYIVKIWHTFITFSPLISVKVWGRSSKHFYYWCGPKVKLHHSDSYNGIHIHHFLAIWQQVLGLLLRFIRIKWWVVVCTTRYMEDVPYPRSSQSCSMHCYEARLLTIQFSRGCVWPISHTLIHYRTKWIVLVLPIILRYYKLIFELN
jgi:hypothetical protein